MNGADYSTHSGQADHAHQGRMGAHRADLSTNYLGLRLKNPLIAGASPLSRSVASVRELEDAGVAAVVIYSVFQEQIEHAASKQDHFADFGTHSFAEAMTYAPAAPAFPRGPEEYAAHVAQVKLAVDIPVIASLNGASLGGWVEYARLLQQAGADALELNVYHMATDPAMSARDVEDRYVDIVTAVKRAVSIPVALKLGPYFSSLANFAVRLDRAGVDGLVLFNRFYQPDINLEQLEVTADLTLSAAHEVRLPLRWIAVLDPLVEASLAATTGVYAWSDVVKLLLVGADATMLCAALLRRGMGVVQEMLLGMSVWLAEHEYEGVHQLQGSMNHRTCSDPAAFERANYMQALQQYS